MKKIILSVCVLLLAAAAGKAQTAASGSDAGKFSIGAEAGFPLGNAAIIVVLRSAVR